ncbi:Avr1b-1 avirulence-like protein [Phytophthora sojae]|uniref:RxLR effector protein n=2 Tax=Phytophthora sojae TaxID=67593 RepID=G4ZSK4_PHYSP|nr:Avr1b-1 avirulence-like protein [Phytophthora sojae]AAO24646.1 unknown protein [Phytophthora sojae]AEK80681.1 Avh110 [Phytophthora sojae]AEK80682.1 Avh110 [Phytophthora sojae]AEK80683.1 Avh110 [Phytophthora sojae]EGZ14226.1 Avr1b-1 avirulence-like protein [Phytophthora sojae]|eukprot:XP_009531655.1 Avr1b-1 avirulence-like protein [Phytophthora sojae]
MRVSSLLVIAAGFLLASSEAFSSESSAKLSIQNAARGTRFLRTAALETTRDDEERGVTMNFAGHFRGNKATKKLLNLWYKTGESEASVAAKLGISSVPQALRSQHENWKALVKYKKLLDDRFARFGKRYYNKKRATDQMARWAVEGKSEAWVAGKLGMSMLSKEQMKVHRNFKAFDLFLQYQKGVASVRVG